MAIMPATDPRVDGVEVFGVCLPAHEVGGDFFDEVAGFSAGSHQQDDIALVVVKVL